MLTPAARLRSALPPADGSPSTTDETRASTVDCSGSRTNPPFGCSSSACTGTRGATLSDDMSCWFANDPSMIGVRVLRARHFRLLGALEASASSSRQRVTPSLAIAVWLPPPGPPTSMRTRPSTRPALYIFCSGQSWSAKASGACSSGPIGDGKCSIGGICGMRLSSRNRFWFETLKRNSVPITVSASWTTMPPSMPFSE